MTTLRYTSTDLDGLPDINGIRYEIIDGDLHVSKAADWHHQFACTALGAALHTWSQQSGAGVTLYSPGLIFASDNDVIPDLVWVSGARLASLLDDAGHLCAAPELVVEVLSPGQAAERRDRELKLKLYSRQGVQEYWIVDWRIQTVQVYRREQAALELTATLQGEDVIMSPLLPGFSCAVPSLWVPPVGQSSVQ
jgi:Uma2 family endonuclease